MHDPMTLAFEIKSPIKRRGQRASLLVVWHRDPEADGSDDSCGWSYPRLTEDQRKRLRGLAWSEAYEPWFQRLRAKRIEDVVEAECLMRGAVQLVCRALDVRASWGDICGWACRMVHNPMDNFRSSLCHLPGYHTNFEEDRRDWREDCAYGLFSGIAHHVLRDRRPWYRHPHFHVHHWRLQIPALQSFLRWAFSRCAGCGKPFPWGYAPISLGWHSDGPRWFRGEQGVYHHDCHARMVASSTPAPCNN